MKTRVTPVLREEARRFALRYACADCVHFDGDGTSPATPERGQQKGVCGEGWPDRVEDDAILLRDEVTFCKQFELA
jgi:hypothetical protein